MWLYTQYVRFSDFFQPYQLLHSLNPYNIQQGSYPPVGYWILAPLLWMNQYAALFVFLALVIGFLVWWLFEIIYGGDAHFPSIPNSGRSRCFRFLYRLPLIGANNDLIIFVIIVLGIASFEEHRDTMAALWIGLAGAAKVLPILYLLHLSSRTKTKICCTWHSCRRCGHSVGVCGFRYGFSEAWRDLGLRPPPYRASTATRPIQLHCIITHLSLAGSRASVTRSVETTEPKPSTTRLGRSCYLLRFFLDWCSLGTAVA